MKGIVVKLDRADLVAAGHTLWQAALASGGVAIVGDAITNKGVDVSGAEQGLGVIAVACLASLGSLVKGYVLKWLKARKTVVSAPPAVTP